MYALVCNSSHFMKAEDDKNKAKLLQGVSPRRLRRTSRKHKSTCLEMIPPIPIPTTIIGEGPSERPETDRRRRQELDGKSGHQPLIPPRRKRRTSVKPAQYMIRKQPPVAAESYLAQDRRKRTASIKRNRQHREKKQPSGTSKSYLPAEVEIPMLGGRQLIRTLSDLSLNVSNHTSFLNSKDGAGKCIVSGFPGDCRSKTLHKPGSSYLPIEGEIPISEGKQLPQALANLSFKTSNHASAMNSKDKGQTNDGPASVSLSRTLHKSVSSFIDDHQTDLSDDDLTSMYSLESFFLDGNDKEDVGCGETFKLSLEANDFRLLETFPLDDIEEEQEDSIVKETTLLTFIDSATTSSFSRWMNSSTTTSSFSSWMNSSSDDTESLHQEHTAILFGVSKKHLEY